MTTTPESYADLAEAAWRWVLGQVRWDDGPARLSELATDDGWEQPWLESPPFTPHSRINDATLGTAGTAPAVARLDTGWNLP